MKFVISQNELNKALNLVSIAVTNRSTMNIMKGILAEVKDGTLTLTGTDNFIRIEKTLHVVEYENGATVLPAKLFADIVRRLSDDSVTVESDEKGMATISTSMSNFSIVCFSADEYPAADNVEEQNTLRIRKDVFTEMVKKTAFAASKDDSRGVLVGILIRSMNDQIDMVALDGFRIAAATTETIGSEESEMIIAASILHELVSILSDAELVNDEIEFRFDSKKAEVITADRRIIMSLLSGSFVRYKELIPTEFATEVHVVKSLLKESVERASLMAVDGRNNLVKLNFQGDELHISSRSESGQVDEMIPVHKTGGDMEIGFNSKYLLEGLKVIDDENIVIKMNANIKPCIIQPNTGSYTYLLLPVRIMS